MPYRGRIQLDFDKIYQSAVCGPFKIIEDLGRDEKSRLHVKIRFIETGTEVNVRYDIAMAGRVNDIRHGIDFVNPYNSYYYGPFKVIDIIGRKNGCSDKIVRIKFLNTGYETEVNFDQVLRGQVMDKSVDYHQRRFISPDYPEHDEYLKHILIQRWRGMMTRCYKEDSCSYESYGAEGVRVCDEWQTVEGFLSTVQKVQFYDKFYASPHMYVLDKDFKQFNIPKNQRIYSPETCIFLSYIDNDNLAIKERHKPGEYYGVKKLPNGNYQVKFAVNGKRISFGNYTDLIAAINEYNYYYIFFGTWEIVPLLNDGYPHMTHQEALQYLVST